MNTTSSRQNDVQEALALLAQGRPADCETALRQILRRHENDVLCRAVCLDGLGRALFALRRPVEALDALEQSLRLLRGQADASRSSLPLLPGVMQNLAHVRLALGRAEESLALGREAAQLAEQIFGPDSPRLAGALLRLSAAYYRGRDFDEAERLMLRAKAIWEAQDGPVPPELGVCLNNLGRICEERGQFTEGIALHRRAVALRRELLGEHEDTAFSLGNLGVALASDGQWEEAAAVLAEAMGLYTRLGKGESPEAVGYRANLAVCREALQARRAVRSAAAEHLK
ncbi:tetratricopeptide repeat protein [Desulfovibrio sp. PG-178-WT-4]|uniref:Tetratricopeptide repeat protein n=1 Tax=Desulfovibrio porci TaxID=2605782 RepID=A0A6L5XNE0_9BACT|nr:tetratricopeptide repeat protein [Desulfovibrio porci]MDY3811071.1 tetratricopeptide repeat protein [Desulfovibrio porci]MSS28666.1 tetratricopeptide repeat protein [Desulfovibrio porci]